MTKPLIIPAEIAQQIFDEAVCRYPDEACGFLLGEISNKREVREFIACKNIQNELNRLDPLRYPRDAKTAYAIDSLEQEDIEKRARFHDFQILSIVHSHTDHDVYFSKEDHDNAAPWGEPLFANVSYVVVGVQDGKVTAMSDFYWDGAKKDFVEYMFDLGGIKTP